MNIYGFKLLTSNPEKKSKPLFKASSDHTQRYSILVANRLWSGYTRRHLKEYPSKIRARVAGLRKESSPVPAPGMVWKL